MTCVSHERGLRVRTCARAWVLAGVALFSPRLAQAQADPNAEEPAAAAVEARPRAPELPADEREGDAFLDLDLGQLMNTPAEIVSATKVQSSAKEVPAIVTVYTREDIRSWGYQSVADLLRHALGFYVLDDYAIPNVSVRGISGGLWSESGTLKVMVDGHSVAFRSTGGNFLGPELVPISAVERIEIIRGPASSLYGADAFLGVINVVTRAGAQLSGAEVTAGAHIDDGHFGHDQDLIIGERLGKFAFSLSYRHNHRNLSGLLLPASSPAPQIPDYNLGTRRASGLRQDSHVGYGKLSYELDRTVITLSGYGSAIEREAAFSPWGQLTHGLDAAGRENHNTVAVAHGHMALRSESVLSKDVTLMLDLVYFRGGPRVRDHIDVGSSRYFLRRRFGFSGIDSNVELRWKVTRNVQTVSGAGVVADRERLPWTQQILKADVGDSPAGSEVPETTQPQGSKTFLNPAVYALAIWSPIPVRLQLTGGLRYDYHNIYGSQVSGRAGVVTSPLENVVVKLLYGSAFKAPSPLLLYGVPLRTGDILGNTKLRPQYVHTIEGQISYTPWEGLTVASGLVYSYMVDKAEFTQQGLNKIAQNLSQLGNWTSETSCTARFAPWLDAYASLEFNRARRNLGRVGYEASLLSEAGVIYPPILAHAGVSGRAPGIPLRLTFEGTYASARRSSDENTLEAGAPYSLRPYSTLDMTLSTVGLHLVRREETVFAFVVRNVTDVQVADPGFAGVDYPRLGRTFFVQMRQDL